MKVIEYIKQIPKEQRNEIEAICQDLLRKGVSRDYIEFAKEYRLDLIEQLSFNVSNNIGFIIGDRFIDVIMLSPINAIHKYEVNYGSEDVRTFDLFQIGDNNIPEGGIFLSTSEIDSGSIYSYLNSPDRCCEDEIVKISDSFTEFMNKIKFYESSKSIDRNSCVITVYREIDVIITDNRDPIKYPWELN